MNTTKDDVTINVDEYKSRVKDMDLACIPICKIKPFKEQPRKNFDKDELAGLVASIIEIGQQTPVSVKPLYDSEDYEFELIDGERRYRACKLAGLKSILAFVLPDMSKDRQFVTSVASNFCRSSHTPIETALALDRMINSFYRLSVQNQDDDKNQCVEKAARVCGRSTTWAYQHLNLLRLCPSVQEYLMKREISFQIAIALSGLKPEYQLEFSKHIIQMHLDSKQSLNYIRNNGDQEKRSGWSRPRKPSDDYAIFTRMISNLNSELANILDMPFKKIVGMFRNRPIGDLTRAIDDLKNWSQEMSLLASNLEDVKQDIKREGAP